MKQGIKPWEMVELADKIVHCYEAHGVPLSIREKDIDILGDRIIFRIKLKPGTRVDDIKKYAKDVQMKMKLPLFSVVIGGLEVSIIISKELFTGYRWHQILQGKEYRESVKHMKIAHPVGIDATGRTVINDLTKYPHLVMAGTTGSGKSGAIKMLLTSLLFYYSPSKLNLVVCDLADELMEFNNFPQLSCPVIGDIKQFQGVMVMLRDEMERRIQMKGKPEYLKLPRIICVIDEFTSFIAGTDAQSKMVREIIMELLRRGRHAKIHMVLASHNLTQKHLKIDVSDMPTKMVFRVARLTDSVTILGQKGAEKLAGNGEMLFQSSQSSEIQQIQGSYISDGELKKILPLIRARWDGLPYDTSYKFDVNEAAMQEALPGPLNAISTKQSTAKQDADNALFAQIALWAMEQDVISCNMLSEIFNIGWRRANRYINCLYRFGIVESLDAKLPRKILPQSFENIPEELMEIFRKSGISDEEVFSVILGED